MGWHRVLIKHFLFRNYSNSFFMEVDGVETRQRINVFVIHTPFHLVQIRRMIDGGVVSMKLPSVIFHSNFVDFSKIQSEIGGDVLHHDLMPCNNFSFKPIFYNWFSQVCLLRNLVQSYLSLLEVVSDIFSSSFAYVYVGTDKDIFSQVLYYKIDSFCKNSKIIFDEGLGLYVPKNRVNPFINFFFALVSKYLFGSPLYRINKLGCHPSTNKVYARYPSLIRKEVSKEYFPIKFKEQISIKYGKVLLILGRPIIEDSTLSFDLYRKLLNCLFEVIESMDALRDFSIHLKPHPREGIDIYKQYRIDSVLPKVSFESIKDVTIGGIICFDSSSLFEIIGSGFDRENIINISFNKRSVISNIFSLSGIYFNGNIDSFKTSFEKQIRRFA